MSVFKASFTFFTTSSSPGPYIQLHWGCFMCICTQNNFQKFFLNFVCWSQLDFSVCHLFMTFHYYLTMLVFRHRIFTGLGFHNLKIWNDCFRWRTTTIAYTITWRCETDTKTTRRSSVNTAATRFPRTSAPHPINSTSSSSQTVPCRKPDSPPPLSKVIFHWRLTHTRQ